MLQNQEGHMPPTIKRKDSMGVSRYLVIRNIQHKTVTSTGLGMYLCDVGAIESSYQKSL